MWTHVIAVLVFAGVCALWVVLQRAQGGERTGVTGECGACAARKRDEDCGSGPGCGSRAG